MANIRVEIRAAELARAGLRGASMTWQELDGWQMWTGRHVRGALRTRKTPSTTGQLAGYLAACIRYHDTK